MYYNIYQLDIYYMSLQTDDNQDSRQINQLLK